MLGIVAGKLTPQRYRYGLLLSEGALTIEQFFNLVAVHHARYLHYLFDTLLTSYSRQ
jgi:hypothetical protein